MKVYIKTFGCAQNERDSQDLAMGFEKKGDALVDSWQAADTVVINSCVVRQTAEDRVYGLINNIKKRSKKKKVILTGCMIGLYGEYKLRKKIAGVEFIKTEDLIKKLGGRGLLSKVRGEGYINIMSGCDNFCSYCVVPIARGRERSKSLEKIVSEVNYLVKARIKKITLLGQNVNSWGKEFGGLKGKTPFAQLLLVLNEIPNLEKISFLTSNPQDLTDDIIDAMAAPKIDRYLHLPVQSGDDEILAKMNRKYTVGQYLNLVKKIRKKIPEIEFGTDIIVGFCGETKRQFENTVKLCKKVGFKVGYIAKYSPRPKTAAYKLDDNVPYTEKKRRWKILDKLINTRG